MLKEKFGGLKKFLESHSETFLIGKEHPFNPTVYLRKGLSDGEVAVVLAGGVLTHLSNSGGRRRKPGRRRARTAPSVLEEEPAWMAPAAPVRPVVPSWGQLPPPPAVPDRWQPRRL